MQSLPRCLLAPSSLDLGQAAESAETSRCSFPDVRVSSHTDMQPHFYICPDEMERLRFLNAQSLIHRTLDSLLDFVAGEVHFS